MSLTESSAIDIARTASLASRGLATLSDADRNGALTALHDALLMHKDSILEANAKDVEMASQAAASGNLSQSVLKRLDLSRPGKYDDMLKGILDVRDLQDPSVLLIIFEARPEVIANIAALSIKSGNAAILKGGKESTESFVAISQVISDAISSTQVPKSSVQLVKTRDVISSLLAQDSFIDLVIPRGSNDLVRFVKDNTKIPVLGHADGLCSAYLHFDADPEVAVKVIVDSKTDYPAACNSLETLLVHQDALETMFPTIANALFSKGVSLRCDAPARAALMKTLPAAPSHLLQDAIESDYRTEFLDLILAVKTIASAPSGSSSVEAAVAHINSHSSKHTDIILTRSKDIADIFMKGVDSAGVFWNASTRFADGMRV
ncbi:hypothetical protein APSETT444_009159 [Aspergillus pseudonomiae]